MKVGPVSPETFHNVHRFTPASKKKMSLMHLEKHPKAFNINRTVDDLVLAPFRDIVAHGEAAVNKAEDSGDGEMFRAARILVREGERALKKIEPLCRKYHEAYGPTFVDALMDDGISRNPGPNST